jgi:hypothetical protein
MLPRQTEKVKEEGWDTSEWYFEVDKAKMEGEDIWMSSLEGVDIHAKLCCL